MFLLYVRLAFGHVSMSRDPNSYRSRRQCDLRQALVVWSLVSLCRYSIPLVVRSPLRPKPPKLADPQDKGASSSPAPESPAHASTVARSCCACAPAGGSAALCWTHPSPPPLTTLKTPKRSVAFQFSTTVQLQLSHSTHRCFHLSSLPGFLVRPARRERGKNRGACEPCSEKR